MPNFYVIATPIGNLEDITLRAVRILKEVDLVLCEDTRTTGRLLSHYGIKTKMVSYNTHSTKWKSDFILRALEDGKNIALVSDAGTPTISDPGSLIVSQIYEHFGDKVKVLSVPGASAVISALSISGFPSSDFLFLGFLPHKKGRETLFREISESCRTVVFYESPHRFIKAVESLIKFAPEKQIVICREMTKIFEEVVHGTPPEIMSYYTKNKDKIKGEFVIVVSS